MKISDITTNYIQSLDLISKKDITDDKRDEIIENFSVGKLWDQDMSNQIASHSVFKEVIEVNNTFKTPYSLTELQEKYANSIKKVIQIIKDLEIPEFDASITDSQKYEDAIFDINKLPDDHLFKDYVNYGMKVQDTYPEYHLINIMSLLSYLVPAKTDPMFAEVLNNTWFIGLGKAGESGKTSGLILLNVLMRQIEEFRPLSINKLPQKPTPESFVDILAKNNRGIWIIDEVSGFLKYLKRKEASELSEHILSIYSHATISRSKVEKKNNKGETVSGGRIDAKDPHVPMLMYTVPDAFCRNIDFDMFDSGFLMRPMYVLPSRDKPMMKDRQKNKDDDQLFKKILDHSLELVDLCRNKVIIFNENELLNDWKLKERENLKNIKSDMKRGGRTRSYEHARKLAILITLGSDDFLSILKSKTDDVPKIDNEGVQVSFDNLLTPNIVAPIVLNFNIPDWAVKLSIEWTELFMKNFDAIVKISQTNNGGIVEKIMQILGEDEWVIRHVVQDAIRKHGRQFDEIMDELLMSGIIEQKKVKTTRRSALHYRLVK
jgi:hypothetical protein